MAKLFDFNRTYVESKTDATEDHDDIVSRLHWSSPEVAGLDRLNACTDDSPCSLEACPVCLRRFRLRLAADAPVLAAKKRAWSNFKVSPYSWRVKNGDLELVDLAAYTTWVRDVFLRGVLDDWPAIIAVRVHPIMFSETEYSSDWFVYLDISIPNEYLTPISLGNFLEEIGASWREVDTHIITNQPLIRQIYSIYSNPYRRLELVVSDTDLKSLGTSRRPLMGPAYRDELARWLLRYPVGSRLVLNNIDLVTSAQDPFDFHLVRKVK